MVKLRRCGADISMTKTCKICGKIIYNELIDLCTKCFYEKAVDVSMGDGRHEVADMMLENKKKIAYAQDDFGINKYGKALHADMNYNWLDMIREELADADKYLECEATRKERVIEMLEYAMHEGNWYVVEQAYAELKKSGTGKEKNPS